MKQKLFKNFIYVIISTILYLICFISINGYNFVFTNSSFIFLLMCFLGIKYYDKSKIEKTIPNIICSIFFSSTFILGREYYYNNRFLQYLNIQNFLLISIQFIIIYYIFYINLSLFFNRNVNQEQSNTFFSKRLNTNNILKIGSIIFICWLPYIIVSYSGCLHWDVFDELAQYFHIENYLSNSVKLIDQSQYITKHHSVLYTYLLGNFAKIININIGLYIFNILEIIFIIFCISKTLLFVNKRLNNNRYLSLIYMIICIYPTVPLYFSILEKDNLFAGFFMLFNIELYKFIKEKKFNIFILIISSCFFILLRNNVIYVLIPYFLFLFIIKYHRKQIIYLFLSFIITIIGLNIFCTINKISDGSKAEMLSIPFQQTARYINVYTDEVTKNEKNTINKVLNYNEILNKYKPTLSDPVKNTFNERNPNNKELKEYFVVWFKMFLKHPLCYIEATINNQIGTVYLFPKYVIIRGYILPRTYVLNNEYIIDKSFGTDLSQLNFKYETKLTSFGFYTDALILLFCNIPIIGSLYIGSLYIWIFIITIINCINGKDYKSIYYLLFCVLYLLIMMLGPCTCVREFRYIYPIYVSVPIYYLILSKNKK